MELLFKSAKPRFAPFVILPLVPMRSSEFGVLPKTLACQQNFLLSSYNGQAGWRAHLFASFLVLPRRPSVFSHSEFAKNPNPFLSFLRPQGGMLRLLAKVTAGVFPRFLLRNRQPVKQNFAIGKDGIFSSRIALVALFCRISSFSNELF